jgi:hypothetical protein
MTTSSHRQLFSSDGLVIKGLVTSSIPEPPVEVLLNNKTVGKFQGLELFEKIAGSKSFPQTVADLVSNSYVRLTYQKLKGRSATFGTSFICCPSFSKSDDSFQLVPKSLKVEVSTETPERLRIESLCSYEDLAQVRSVRTYATKAEVGRTTMIYESTFTVLKDLHLRASNRGTDAFRLFSISSMYSDSNCYDGNVVQWRAENGADVRLRIQDVKERKQYLFRAKSTCSEFSLLKEIGSTGRKSSPGSPDSPSARVQLLDCSIPKSELSIQGFLAPSTNINDDSLTIWMEWRSAPKVIKEGTRISARAKFCSFPIQK